MKLLESFNAGAQVFSNRMAMAPMSRRRAEHAVPTDHMRIYYESAQQQG